jgi:hypothetical protein
MSKKNDAAPAARASVRVRCFYAEAVPGDVVEVDAEEAARLIALEVAVAVEAVAASDAGGK